MSQTIDVNGQSINYPETGDTNWGDEATDFAVQTSAAFGKLGLASGTSVDIGQTLDVTGNTTLDANLSVGGDASVTGNTTLTGNVAITGNETVGGTLGVTGNVAINTNKFNVTASSGNTTIAGTLGVTGNTTVDGVIYADDNTTANTPVISFTGDTNTGFGRSGADTLDFITNGNSRFRIEPTGQIKAVYESQVGTDYNTQLDNGYLCRAWAKINQNGTQSIYASGNISTLTDGGNGITTFNFTTSLPDTNYAAIGTSSGNTTENWSHVIGGYLVDKVTIQVGYTIAGSTTFVLTDRDDVTLAVFR